MYTIHKPFLILKQVFGDEIQYEAIVGTYAAFIVKEGEAIHKYPLARYIAFISSRQNTSTLKNV